MMRKKKKLLLSLFLSDKNDFSAILHSVNTVLGTLKVMGEDRETNHLILSTTLTKLFKSLKIFKNKT